MRLYSCTIHPISSFDCQLSGLFSCLRVVLLSDLVIMRSGNVNHRVMMNESMVNNTKMIMNTICMFDRIMIRLRSSDRRS